MGSCHVRASRGDRRQCVVTRLAIVCAPVSLFSGFGLSSISPSGVSVRDIPNADDTYAAMKDMVDARSA